ncbi:Uncharacterized protein Adt_28119 [Abeliophyllum distichum]|uniref:Uncharacterized protein n=1 Tax=Abeliophyllum distichum TaxID=126358 RepID=A0ABD1RVM7_9LAMI
MDSFTDGLPLHGSLLYSMPLAVNEHNVVLKVLGERKGTPACSWMGSEGHFPLSHLSTMTLRGPIPVAVNLLKASNALKSKMETYMQQINEFITQFTSNLQSVMPGIQLPTPPPPPPPLSPMHEEELDSSNDENYLSDLYSFSVYLF